ncbi:MAG: tetratricopeptide repeat protein [Burkholderiales bacterium]
MAELHALLLTDIVDSTRLTEELGDARMAELWTAHDRIARDLLPLWRGREIDKTDGMLLLFDALGDALGYALAYHRALAGAQLPIRARAGIHVGLVTLRPNPPDDVARGAKPIEVDGLALPIAARVMSVALGAQTLLSADARFALGAVPQRVVSHGHWRLQGVADPVELFEAGNADAAFVAPPDGPKVYRVVRQGELWQPVREVRHSVPAERDSFVGRQESLQLLAKKFEDGARLVSVLGIGGTGKTRLATRFAWSRLGDYPGGVWFCDLSQARSVDGIHFAVAQGLDVPLGQTDPVVQLAHAIAGRGECLVILDNFEQVARHAEETLGRWLERAPQAKFIVTTREVLGIVGEATFALDPLPIRDAAALFVRRAQAAKSGFQTSADDDAAIGQLVRVLDGLPLAIELAAARVRAMPPRTMLARMHERFDVLLSRAGRRDRQATLRAAFDWSWELLSEAERVALAQLSVFRGGFTHESSAAVLDVSSLSPASRAVDLVDWLVDKSFVRQIDDARFDLLESVREYAAEHLRTEGRFAGSGHAAFVAAELRHGTYFSALGPRRATEHSCVELDNLVAACRRAVARGDGTTAADALTSAWGAIELQGPFRLGVELAEAVSALAGLSAESELKVGWVSGAACQLVGKSTEATRHLQQAVARARALGDRLLEARALHVLAPRQAQRGQIAEAAASFESALESFRALGERGHECAVLNGLGGFCESLGRMDDAQRHYEAGLQLAREAGERRWEGGAAGNLAQFHANLGQPSKARPLYAQAVQIAQELGDRQWQANARCNLGLMHFTEGRLGDAQTELEASLAAARDMGYAQLLSIVQCNLGLVAEARGAVDQARAYHEAAVALARELGDRRGEGQFLTYLGVLDARQARFDSARAHLATGEALLRSVSDRVSLGILLCARAETEHRGGAPDAADAALAQADALAREITGIDPESEFGQALDRTRDLVGAVA